MTPYEERCIRQYKSHVQTRSDHSLLMRVEGGLWDLFQGSGWKHHSRVRIIKSRDSGKRALIQVSGLTLSPALREVLLKECQS